MDTKLDINVISCKSCRANLPLLGNTKRSKSITCDYCGCVMDIQNEFKVLYTYDVFEHLKTKLKVGMRGTIQGIVFTITGYVIYKSKDEEWVSFQLYSATHGYAYLIRKDQRYSFYRKTYHLPEQNLWTLKKGDQFSALEQKFIISNFHIVEVTFTAGTLITSVLPSQRYKQCFADSDKMKYLSIQQKNDIGYFKGYEIRDSELKTMFSGET